VHDEILTAHRSMLAEGEFTEAEYNKLKRKVDFILLPLVRPVLLALGSPQIAGLFAHS
jgi:hypothetical protein